MKGQSSRSGRIKIRDKVTFQKSLALKGHIYRDRVKPFQVHYPHDGIKNLMSSHVYTPKCSRYHVTKAGTPTEIGVDGL